MDQRTSTGAYTATIQGAMYINPISVLVMFASVASGCVECGCECLLRVVNMFLAPEMVYLLIVTFYHRPSLCVLVIFTVVCGTSNAFL